MSTEKCERCGEPGFQTAACFRCKTTHLLCEECIDTYQFTYANEHGPCFLKEPVLGNRHGGKREGAGRPKGSIKKNKKISYATKLRPDQVTWLKAQKNQAREIETALDRHIEKNHG